MRDDGTLSGAEIRIALSEMVAEIRDAKRARDADRAHSDDQRARIRNLRRQVRSLQRAYLRQMKAHARGMTHANAMQLRERLHKMRRERNWWRAAFAALAFGILVAL